MALKPWSAFHQEILVYAPQCPRIVVDRHLRNAAIEFCERTNRLKAELDSFSTAVGVRDYDLDADSGTDLVTVLDCTIDGEPIDPARRDELAALANWTTDQGVPTKFMTIDPITLRLWKTPAAVHRVDVSACLKPKRAATGIESWFADSYMSDLASGAMARIFAIPSQPWTNAGLAKYHSDAFEAGVRKASAHAARDGTRAPLRTAVHSRA